VKELLNVYKQRKHDIKNALMEFSKMKESDERTIFSELCFCLCTPQSKALACWAAIERLGESGILFSGDDEKIKKMLMGVRFHNTKARRIFEIREKLFKREIELKTIKQIKDDFELRRWLIKNVKGLGMKEASHFMRNIGRGKNVAILDRHILKNLHKYKVIDRIPKTLTEKKYLEIEQMMKEFARKIKIPLDGLDLLLWAEESGFIFK